jgi:hypothetical protein
MERPSSLRPPATDKEGARASSEAAPGPDKTTRQATSQYRGEGDANQAPESFKRSAVSIRAWMLLMPVAL